MVPLLAVVLGLLSTFAHSLYVGQFNSDVWVADRSKSVDGKAYVSFIVALQLRDVDHMHNHLQDVSNPTSGAYGQYLSLEELNRRYSITSGDRKRVVDYFSAIEGAQVHADELSDMFEVTAPVSSVHAHFSTQLSWVGHATERTSARSLRAVKPLTIPEDLHSLISFVSLNSPVSRVVPRAARSLANRRKETRKAAGEEAVKDERMAQAHADVAAGLIGTSPGNEEALAFFKPFCGAAATTTNQENPPCASAGAADKPSIQVAVSQHANIRGDTYLISQEPTIYNVPTSSIYCYNIVTHVACSGADGNNCNCIAKV